MSIKLPDTLKPSWKHYLLSLQFQSVHANTISRHVQTLYQICTPPKSALLTQLNSSDFWEDLKSASFFDRSVLELEELWQKIGH